MKKKYLTFLLSAMFLGGLTSCNDWLDVEQNTEKPAESMFDNYDGFKGALTGCYSDMTKTDLYGTRLTMSSIESLASLWYLDEASLPYYSDKIKENYYLRVHDYGHTMSQDVIKAIYSGLYNAILETNMVIKAFQDGKGTTIIYPESRAVVEGEAYAMRAFLHLDVLRLFGEVPGGSTKVELPYSEITDIEEQLSFYSFDEYVAKIKADLEKALSLMKDNDPVFQYTLKELNNVGVKGYENVSVEDDFMTYRQYRINYWAVKAIEARLYLYIGDHSKAHEAAMEVINATTTDGKKVVELSGMTDYGQGIVSERKFASPSECLFSLYFDNLHDISVPLLAGSPTFDTDSKDVLQPDKANYLMLTPTWKDDLFLGCDGQDIRKRFMWADTKDTQSNKNPTISKYYVKESGIIPLIRLSEMYLIAIETATTLEEANGLYETYMESKDVARKNFFKSMDEIKTELPKEYRREFFAEGQMFYFYKRNKTEKLWSNESMTLGESEYIIPRPNNEY